MPSIYIQPPFSSSFPSSSSLAQPTYTPEENTSLTLPGQALLLSHTTPTPILTPLLPRTAGILFLGTPHAGSSLADWGLVLTRLTTLLRPTNTPLVSALRPTSETLANLQQDFHGMLSARQARGETVPRIFCFFEERGIGGGVGEVVPRHSAVLSAYPSQGVAGKDHVGMCRFGGRSEAGYLSVSGQLRVWAQELEGGDVDGGGGSKEWEGDGERSGRTGAGAGGGGEKRRCAAECGSRQASRLDGLGAGSQVWSGTVNSVGGTVIQGNLSAAGDLNIGGGQR